MGRRRKLTAAHFIEVDGKATRQEARMRCGVLHNGRFGDMKHNVGRVVFALPGKATFVNCKMGDAYVYSVVDFCKNFTWAVNLWMEKNKDDENVKANLPRLMQYRPKGFAPYIAGMAVLA